MCFLNRSEVMPCSFDLWHNNMVDRNEMMMAACRDIWKALGVQKTNLTILVNLKGF